MTLLRREMQSAADAAAMARALNLDGKASAQDRARMVARNAVQNASSMPATGAGTSLSVKAVNFYSAVSPKMPTAADLDSKFIEVELDPQTVSALFVPVMNLVGPTVATTQTLDASAIARPDPYICKL